MDGLVPITRIPGLVPFGPLILSADIARCIDASATVDRARHEANSLLEQAGEVVAQARRDADDIRTEARREGLADAVSEMEAMRKTLVSETVNWLVTETDLELLVAERVDASVRTLIAQVLQEFAEEQDSTEILLRRVSARLPNLLGDAVLTLKVPTSALKMARSTFERDHRLRVIADASLPDKRAVLESPFLTLQMDIDAHLAILLSSLTRQESTDARQNLR